MTGRRRLLAVAALGVACLVGAPAGAARAAAAATSEGDVYLSIGILEYAEGNYKEAIANLEKARQLDPRDVGPPYYLGLAHNAQGDYATGLRFLEQARGLEPENLDVRFQIGLGHFAQRNYRAAQPEFQFVFDRNPRYENVGYYLGYVYYERRQFDRALPLFQQNVTADPQFRQLAQFYAGLALQNLGRSEEAVRQLALSAQTAPHTPLTDVATRLARSVETGVRDDQRFRLEFKVAGLYDNNVTVAPNTNILGLRNITRESLGNLFSVQGNYDFYRSANWRATAGFGFLQTLYYMNDNFNLADFIPSLSVAYINTWGGMRYFTGLQYSYEYLTLGENQFLQRHTVGPYFSLEQNPNNLTQIQLQLQYKNFQFDPPVTEENRDAFNYLAGITHFFRFEQDRHYIKLGFTYDRDATIGGDYRYNGYQALVGFQVTLGWDVRVRVDGQFYWRYYPYDNFLFSATPGNCRTGPEACVKRKDFEKIVQASLAKDFGGSSKLCTASLPWAWAKRGASDCFTASLEFLGDFNRSRNTPIFQYNRQVISLGLSWRY